MCCAACLGLFFPHSQADRKFQDEVLDDVIGNLDDLKMMAQDMSSEMDRCEAWLLVASAIVIASCEMARGRISCLGVRRSCLILRTCMGTSGTP